MRKLSKEQRARHREIAIRLNNLQAKAAQAIAALNAEIDIARDFVLEVSSEMDAYFDEKSEKWQKGEAGQAYEEWKSAWVCDDLVDAEEPPDVSTTFDELPMEPNA